MVLLDIEGTTTPVSFVTEVLFPFARERLEDFLTTLPPEERDPLVRSLGTERQAEPPEARAPTWCGATPDEERASALAYLHWLMDRDRKSTTLKSFQGRIWKEGYASGALKGALYALCAGARQKPTRLEVPVLRASAPSTIWSRIIASANRRGEEGPAQQ